MALLPLVLVGVANKLLTDWIPHAYGATTAFAPSVVGTAAPVVQEVPKLAAIWAVEGAGRHRVHAGVRLAAGGRVSPKAAAAPPAAPCPASGW